MLLECSDLVVQLSGLTGFVNARPCKNGDCDGNNGFLQCGHSNGFGGSNSCRGGDGDSKECGGAYGGHQSCRCCLDGICGNGSGNGRCGKGHTPLSEEFP